MAKGYDQHLARTEALQALGKNLARRAKSRCEISGTSGVPLFPYEVPPVASQPDMERTLLVCESCLKALASPKHLRGREWQFLQTTVWSELPATQVVAYRMLKVLSLHEDWALNTIEELFLDPEIESWALAAPL